MQVIERTAELAAVLAAEEARGCARGLVATMGALHDGHASLVELAATDCDTVWVSVFVNPLQFGPEEDLTRYPRQLDDDLAIAEKAGASVVFVPTVEEMTPADARTRVRVSGVGEVLEGASRPGHFEGVATVVAKLLAMTRPQRAYFGEKDFQQLVVVRRLTVDLSFPVEVVGCPTVRDVDGVALSSRDRYLSADERAAAAVLYRALRAGAAAILAGEADPGQVRELMGAIIDAEPLVGLDYAEVVDQTTLATPARLSGRLRLLVAAQVGATRLIDNLGLRQ